MGRIREILLSQYIGAITIGFLVAQGVIAFISGIMRAITAYYGPARSVLAESRASTAQFTLIDSTASAFLYFLIAYLLLRWLYLRQESRDDAAPTSHAVSTDQGEPQ